MRRGLYVIFYRTGEVYAGKYYDFNKIGKSYFGSSGIAKQMNLEPAHVVKWALPQKTSVEKCDFLEKSLINYIANRYGLHNLVFYRGDEVFYSRFPHNGRCINCHDNDSEGLRALKPILLNKQAQKLYGVNYEDVTEEMRHERRKRENKEWYANHKDYVKIYQRQNEDRIREYNQREDVKKAHSANTMKCYWKKKKTYNKKRTKRMAEQRKLAQEIFGFFEYLDVEKIKRKISVGEIEKKRINYEPQNPDWKHYFFSDEYIKPEPKPESLPRNSREESFMIFGFYTYTDVNDVIHEVSAEERKYKILANEPKREEIKHFYKPGIISTKKKETKLSKRRIEVKKVFGVYTYLDVKNVRHEISLKEARSKKLRFEPKDKNLKRFYREGE